MIKGKGSVAGFKIDGGKQGSANLQEKKKDD